jgi:hypothetical protein
VTEFLPNISNFYKGRFYHVGNTVLGTTVDFYYKRHFFKVHDTKGTIVDQKKRCGGASCLLCSLEKGCLLCEDSTLFEKFELEINSKKKIIKGVKKMSQLSSLSVKTSFRALSVLTNYLMKKSNILQGSMKITIVLSSRF